MYCYAVNGRCASPCHLWLTGCEGEMGSQLKRLPGFDNWIIEKENRPYIEALQEQKENLVYLTADAETVLEELDLKKIYIVRKHNTIYQIIHFLIRNKGSILVCSSWLAHCSQGKQGQCRSCHIPSCLKKSNLPLSVPGHS